MDTTVKRFILTGAPGTGKTSVLEALSAKGHTCFPEVSRIIIREQQQMNGTFMPWLNLEQFAQECRQRMLHHLSRCPSGISFFDRGLPDNIAYLRCKNLVAGTEFHEQLEQYNSLVFYFPLWPKIYVNDPQRPETLEHAAKVDQSLRYTYHSLGYKLVEMPLDSVTNRVQFIENHINQF